MKITSKREAALRSEGEEIPHAGPGSQRDRIKRRTDKVRRADGKAAIAREQAEEAKP